MSAETIAEWSGATIEFLKYHMTQLLHHSRGRTPSQPSHRLAVLEFAAEQVTTIRAITKTELEQLEA
jgi:hypothetical protein